MSWLFAEKYYQSEKNGLITCRKFLGQWIVEVDHYDQSSPYIKRMWRSALGRLPAAKTVSRTLLLGLGAGSIVDDLHKLEPEAFITVIEYDPVMVEISQDLKLFKYTPKTIIEDAQSAVPKLDGPFSLIVVDLYRGGKTAKVLEQPEFIKSISEKLSPEGQLLLNVFENTALLQQFDQYFVREKNWTFSYNSLALYKKSPALASA